MCLLECKTKPVCLIEVDNITILIALFAFLEPKVAQFYKLSISNLQE